VGSRQAAKTSMHRARELPEKINGDVLYLPDTKAG
jgi:hypothetical protein